MSRCRVPVTNELFRALRVIAHEYRANNHILEEYGTVDGSFGLVQIEGPECDEEGAEYIRVGFALPEGVMAELSSGEAGLLEAFQIYRYS